MVSERTLILVTGGSGNLHRNLEQLPKETCGSGHITRRMRCLTPIFVGLLAFAASPARADGTLLTDDTWRYASSCDFVLDGGLVVGFPAALPTGLSTGIGAGFARGTTLAWGARASWSTATESSMTWDVTQSDLRLRATAALQHAAGRGTFGVRLGLGGTLVHESRIRNQGKRAGLTGSELEDSAFALLPGFDLEGVVALHVAGPWLFVVSGGPSAHYDSGVHGGWTSQLGVAWQP